MYTIDNHFYAGKTLSSYSNKEKTLLTNNNKNYNNNDTNNKQIITS